VPVGEIARFTNMLPLQQWQDRVQREPGHEYLETFHSWIRGLLAHEHQNPGQLWQEVTRTLGQEVACAILSHERAFPYQKVFASRGSFKKLSDGWGEFVQTNRKCGGYVVAQGGIDRNPGCPCGGPHYRFELELSRSWCNYVALCFDCLSTMSDEFAHLNLPHPCLARNTAGGFLLPFRPIELHVGWGAFIAHFYQELDCLSLSSILSKVGFDPPKEELEAARFESYPSRKSIFFLEDSEDESIVSNLLAGLKKSCTKGAGQILNCLLEGDKGEIYARLNNGR
jgi:hypothetical protein